MALSAGTRLGPYEIQSVLGAGGMGEVYKARDTRLDRTVAIKVLPETLASDPQFRERFDREARTISQLTHPHICTLYDVGRDDLTDFLVMEYLEGDTLDDRLGKGALPLDRAVTIAIQIASALDKAHRARITHRDLKPGNIMLTRAGAKLLDFGLAKTRATVIAGAGLSMLPTTPPGLTAQGTILGTFQYMAPEQLEGREADARTDIFAFGAVLYEMLTGKKAFEGKSHASLISAIMSSEPPPISALQPLAPPALDHVVKRCLAKDPDDRWQTAGDVMRELKWLTETASQVTASTAVVPAARRGRRQLVISWTVAAACAGAAIALGTLYFRSSTPTAPSVRFEVTGPGPRTPNDGIAISPDGRRVVYVGDDGHGGNSLWVRSLDSLEAQKLPGTDRRGYMWPFWSPDSRFIGFANDGKLMKIDVTGGPAETIVELAGQSGGSAWNRDGTVLFASNDHGLQRISASGGAAAPVTQRDASLEERYHDCPSFLPDGRHFLYLAYSTSKPENRAVYVSSLDSPTRTRLMASNSCAIYAAGYILFLREQTLLARPFNADRLEFTGEAASVAQGVAAIAQGEVGLFAASDAGTLIFRKALAQSADRRLQWMDRTGKTSMPIGPPLRAASLRLSPDGKRVAFSEGVDGGADDLWVYDIDRDVKVRLTTDPGLDHNPVWSPDGSRLVYDSHRSNIAALYEIPASGAVPERLLLAGESGMQQGPRAWSPDGRLIVFQKAKVPKAAVAPLWNLWVLSLSGDRKPFPYIESPFSQSEAALSPNGRWLAYVSNESGKYDVIVQPFPDPSGGKWQISTQGGAYPRWKRDGREIYYVTPSGGMIAVAVMTAPTFDIGKSTLLFQTPLAFSGDPGGSPYDVTADGQQFLMSVPAANASPITVVLNWSEGLTK